GRAAEQSSAATDRGVDGGRDPVVDGPDGPAQDADGREAAAGDSCVHALDAGGEVGREQEGQLGQAAGLGGGPFRHEAAATRAADQRARKLDSARRGPPASRRAAATAPVPPLARTATAASAA